MSHFPGYKNRAPSKQLFLKRTAGVEELRNIFQHLVGDLPALTKADVPVLGSLSWLVPIDIEKRTFAASIFSPGRVRNLDPASVVELPAELPNELTQIELHLAEKTVNITSLRAAVADLVSALEKPLREASGNTTLCDALSHVVLEYLPKDEAP
ncbi:MAG TPA: hypothetical protein VFG04_02810 [Planctomycetaceae bacterium]|nr:hypothetical protein [Planctomycetaceae bacterium]